MKNKISQHFNQITNDIYILKIMYFISYPLAKLFVYFKISPNTVTTLSNIFIILSIYALFQGYMVTFIFLWIFASFLDFCDGLVARLSNRSSEFGAFYDQFSDQIKFLIFILSLIIYFNNIYLTILSVTTLGMYFTYHILALKDKTLQIGLPSSIDVIKHQKGINIIKQIYYIFFLIHGHTMVFLPLLFIDVQIAFFGIIILLISSIKHVLFILQKILLNIKIIDTN